VIKEKTRQKDVAVRKEKTGSDKATHLRRRAEALLEGKPESMEEKKKTSGRGRGFV